MANEGIKISGWDLITPNLTIPLELATELMMYGAAAYDQFSSEFGAQLKVHRDGRNWTVVDYHPYKQVANGGYWEAAEGEVEAFMLGISDEDMPNWCALFHTHPPAMSANMSGTDVDWLKTMAGDWNAVSVISPVDKNGNVDPSKWRYHYASDLVVNGECTGEGQFMVSNMVPTFKMSTSRSKAFIDEHVKELVSKKVHVPKHTNSVGNSHWSNKADIVTFMKYDWLTLKDYDVEMAAAMESMQGGAGITQLLEYLCGSVVQVEDRKWDSGVQYVQLASEWLPLKLFTNFSVFARNNTLVANELEDEAHTYTPADTDYGDSLSWGVFSIKEAEAIEHEVNKKFRKNQSVKKKASNK